MNVFARRYNVGIGNNAISRTICIIIKTIIADLVAIRFSLTDDFGIIIVCGIIVVIIVYRLL